MNSDGGCLVLDEPSFKKKKPKRPNTKLQRARSNNVGRKKKSKKFTNKQLFDLQEGAEDL